MKKVKGEIKMKKQYLLILTILMLIPCYMFAGWDDPDKGYFDTQKNIDQDVSDLSESMATISYEGKLLNFINYNDGTHSKIIIRTLTNTSEKSIVWSQKKDDDIPNLTKLSDEGLWQPAPVVYNDILYLFVSVQVGPYAYSPSYIHYSAYNSGSKSWSKPKIVMAPKEITTRDFMSAVTVDNKLCLITKGESNISIFWTSDMQNWTECPTDLNSNYSAASVITQTYMTTKADKTKKRETKILIGYLNWNDHAMYAEYQFDDSDVLKKLKSQTISTDHDYNSIALAEGTIKGDASTGRCVQAFLKLAHKDNGYCRYRIQRYQSKNGDSWTKRENNLVEQNYLWADKNLPLTVAKFGVADTVTHNIRQYMCLVYRGYNDFYHPLQSAWAETDKLVYDASKAKHQTLGGPENTQYIGYVEGPPPYYLNNQPLEDPYIDPNAVDISSLEFSTSSSKSTEREIGYEIGGNLKFEHGIFKSELSAAFGQAWGSEYKKTTTNTFEMYAGEEALGYYITLKPTITRAFYKICDVYDNVIDSTYHFTMSDPVFDLDMVELKPRLNPEDPTTYFQRPGINFSSFATSTYGSASNSWTVQSHVDHSIGIEKSESQTNSTHVELSLGLELGEMFDIGIEGSFEYSLTTTTTTGNEVKSVTRLNKPSLPTDLYKMNYSTYWLKPSTATGVKNWWLHEGALDQNTWCVTYEVTYLEYKNGKTVGNDHSAQVANSVAGDADAKVAEKMATNVSDDLLYQAGYQLLQNSPNPFNQATVIKYQIGFGNTQSNSANQSDMTKLVVNDMRGNVVATLVNEIKSPGSYEVRWDASGVLPGVYFYSLQSGSFKDVKKLVLLK